MEKEVKLFDKRFVYFMWDDELEGKEVFASNDIYSLMDSVNNGRETDGLVKKFGYSNCPFLTVKGNRLYQFVYYDPNYEVKKAYNEGKKIQVAYKGANNWVDCDEPEWVDGCQFRVKPEEKRYRPYESLDEMLSDFNKRFPTVAPKPAFSMPLVWIGLKGTSEKSMITRVHGLMVYAGEEPLSMRDLFDKWIYLDGSPVGMEVKE